MKPAPPSPATLHFSRSYQSFPTSPDAGIVWRDLGTPAARAPPPHQRHWFSWFGGSFWASGLAKTPWYFHAQPGLTTTELQICLVQMLCLALCQDDQILLRRVLSSDNLRGTTQLIEMAHPTLAYFLIIYVCMHAYVITINILGQACLPSPVLVL